jgi:hypothetical protein
MSGRITSIDDPPKSNEPGAPRDPLRRDFLKSSAFAATFGGGAALLASAGVFHRINGRWPWPGQAPRLYPGELLGPSFSLGHRLRDATISGEDPPSEAIDTVIVGGGVAGLSAGWWLAKHGQEDFTLLELEPETGGNSRCGGNSISRYPWGAHYLPLPGPSAVHVSELLEELGVIQGRDSENRPIYNELYLCSDPHERLFHQGRWHEGLVPQSGLSARDREDYRGFFGEIERLKAARGQDGRPVFSIPLDTSSRDAEWLALDRETMAEFLRRKGWNSEKLHWYVNYCCRDDYGVGYDSVSAWAGLHYFAARVGRGANADSQTVLTWPEGNGWLAERLRDKCRGSVAATRIRTGALVRSIEPVPLGGARVDYLEVSSGKSRALHARQVIFAAPRFVAPHVIGPLKRRAPEYLAELRYGPWLVANVSVQRLPAGNGASVSWDNVSYYSRSLGYVVATHQSLSLFPGSTVLTYYRPLDDMTRVQALATQKDDWSRLVAEDLESMHPGIRDGITRIDSWVWGHGMISPKPGFIWGESRKRMGESLGSIHFAHSDMSGISIFEEAQYRGVRAAQKVLDHLRRPG